METIQLIKRKVLGLLVPPPELKISEHAEKTRVLSIESAGLHGKYSSSLAKFQIDMMDAFCDPHVEQVIGMTGIQLGKTTILENVISYKVDQDPSPILLVRPTQGDAEDFSKERIAPMIRDTPVLRNKFADAKARDSGNTLTHKKFYNGFLAIVGANSPLDLASRPAPFVLMDEVDKFPESAGAEGDPVDLATKRTSNFWNRKIGLFSSPTDKGSSRIEKAYNQSDRRQYNVPCPDCNHEQVLDFKRIKYEIETKEGRPTIVDGSAQYACKNCGVLIPHYKKSSMIEAGRWIATKPFRKIAGFWISSLYSPWVSWDEICQEYLDCKDDPIRYKTWINTRLAETWEERGDAPDWENIYARREFYKRGTIPKGGVVLVAAGDVQHDRIEVEIVAYGRRLESWSVDYHVLYGSPTEPDVWKQLDELLEDEYPYEIGGSAKIKRFAIDTGDGQMTAYIYLWARRKGPRRVMAIKGNPTSRGSMQILSTPKRMDINFQGQQIKSGVYLWLVGGNILKSELYANLRKKKLPAEKEFPGGYCHFPDYPEEYFKMLTAEEYRQRRHPRTGRTIFEWVNPPGRRNEALDCRVYARAVAESLGISQYTDFHWNRIEKMLAESSGKNSVRYSDPAIPKNHPKPQGPPTAYKPLGKPIR